MKKLFIIVALVLAYPCGAALWARYFVAAPLVTVSSSTVLVGDEKSDHAMFKAGAATVVKGTTIDYGFNTFDSNTGFLAKLGGRAILTSMQTPAYDHMVDQQQSSGTCMAVFLNQNEQQGLLSHVVLIPASPEVMNDMRLTRLSEGVHFSMHGRPLTLREASVGGNSLGTVRGISYFLVDSFSRG